MSYNDAGLKKDSSTSKQRSKKSQDSANQKDEPTEPVASIMDGLLESAIKKQTAFVEANLIRIFDERIQAINKIADDRYISLEKKIEESLLLLDKKIDDKFINMKFQLENFNVKFNKSLDQLCDNLDNKMNKIMNASSDLRDEVVGMKRDLLSSISAFSIESRANPKDQIDRMCQFGLHNAQSPLFPPSDFPELYENSSRVVQQKVNDNSAIPPTLQSWSEAARNPVNPSSNRNGSPNSIPPARRVILRGKNIGSSIKTIPKRIILFVSRLAKETKDEDLSEFLSAAGVRNVYCKKLEPKDGQTFYSAAFRVSCDLSSEGLLRDESTWPEGAEIREWYNKTRQS